MNIWMFPKIVGFPPKSLIIHCNRVSINYKPSILVFSAYFWETPKKRHPLDFSCQIFHPPRHRAPQILQAPWPVGCGKKQVPFEEFLPPVFWWPLFLKRWSWWRAHPLKLFFFVWCFCLFVLRVSVFFLITQLFKGCHFWLKGFG